MHQSAAIALMKVTISACNMTSQARDIATGGLGFAVLASHD